KIEEVVINSQKAIWRKSPSEVSDEEYNQFYKHISHDFDDPLEKIHYRAEGTLEFFSILFIPKHAPFDLFMPDRRHGIHLYVKNVFITDDCKELLPEYLRFVRGVVDSSDLSLNVSREMLQDDAIIRRIRKNLVSKILNTLKEMKEKRADDYLTFWNNFGKVLKEGMHTDFENRERIQELLLFPNANSNGEKKISLREYVEAMPENQKEIYYLAGNSLDWVLDSPYLEGCRQRGFDVLFFTDPVDEFVAQSLTEYDGRKLRPLDRGDVDFGDGEEVKKENEEKRKQQEETYKELMDAIAKQLETHVKEVRISERLTDSPCCLVADAMGMSAHMEQLLKAMGQQYQPSRRILEINPNHPIIQKLNEFDKTSGEFADYCYLLLNQALMAEGSPVVEPGRFNRLLASVMTKVLTTEKES
ncbi:MAG: molecular chaperone HtpG, partial [Lentisphaerae bacterium]